jgi:hypothetical protein
MTALERDDARYEALATEFDRLRSEVAMAEGQLEAKRKTIRASADAGVDQQVNAALGLLDDICRVASDDRARTEINPLLTKLGVRLGLNFTGAIERKRRAVR